MKRGKYTDEQILAIVKEGEAGRKVVDPTRWAEIWDTTSERYHVSTLSKRIIPQGHV